MAGFCDRKFGGIVRAAASGKPNGNMLSTRPNTLDPPVDPARDHVLGPPDAAMTLVQYGSYACQNCHVVHEVVEGLRSRFGERMRTCFDTRRGLAMRTRSEPRNWRSTPR